MNLPDLQDSYDWEIAVKITRRQLKRLIKENLALQPQTERLMIVDFDDTIAKTTEKVKVYIQGGGYRFITSEEFATFVPSPGEYIDDSSFAEFDDVDVRTARPLKPIIDMLKSFSSSPKPRKLLILTARKQRAEQGIRDFLRTAGVDDTKIDVIGVGDKNPAAKVKVVHDYLNNILSGVNFVSFFDDSGPNVAAVKQYLANMGIEHDVAQVVGDPDSNRRDLIRLQESRKFRLIPGRAITENPRRIEECIIVGGMSSGDHVLAKSRDRNYHARVEIVRRLLDDGTEIVYMRDLDTGYAEGMNSHGIGVVNAALSISDDEKAIDKTKSKVASDDGPRLLKCLTKHDIDEAIKSLVGFMGGIKGHTFVGNPDSLYSVEMSSEHTPIINKLDPTTGWDIRTNHGHDHDGAGYTPDRRPDDYMSSKIRQAQAEVELSKVDDFSKIAPALAKQNFERESNNNMLRRVPDKGMKTTSQVAMHLANKEFRFYQFPNECTIEGFADHTPDGYKPKINIRVFRYGKDR